jgi:hypothetical protein
METIVMLDFRGEMLYYWEVLAAEMAVLRLKAQVPATTLYFAPQVRLFYPTGNRHVSRGQGKTGAFVA